MEGVLRRMLLRRPASGQVVLTTLCHQPRYLVVGGPQRDRTAGIIRAPSNRSSAPRELFRVPSEGIYLSIYKSKVSCALGKTRRTDSKGGVT